MFDVLTLGFFWLDGGRVGANRTIKTILAVLRRCEIWGNYDPSKDRDLVSLFHRRTSFYTTLDFNALATCGSHFAVCVRDPRGKSRVMTRMLIDVPLYLTPKGSAYASRAAERRSEYVTREQCVAAWDDLQREWAELSEAARITMFQRGRRAAAEGEGYSEP